MNNEFQIRAIRASFDWHPDDIELFAKQSQGRNTYYAQELKFREVVKGDRVEPFLRFEKHCAQKLMDDLWDCGLRPSEGSGSAGAMLATQKHLEDMKTIAFHSLKIQKENR